MAYKKRKDEYTIVQPQYNTSYTLSPYGQHATVRRPALTSLIEVRDIIAALLALTIAFSWLIYVSDGKGFLYYFGIAATVVVTGFLLHEMSHKVFARKFGCWAEFRADYRGLGLVLVTAFFGFLFAAPGAVWIRGNVTRDQNGKISLAGPGSNIVVAAVCVTLLSGGAIGVSGNVRELAYDVLYFNAILAAFNMIPVMPFDGSKIWSWNKPIYIATLVAAGLLFYLGYTRTL